MDIKSIDELIQYLQDEKGIAFSENDKHKFQLIGYYHAYKGYRFFNKSSTELAYKSFGQLLEVYNFDMGIKADFYSPLMRIETALKNYTLEELLSVSSSNSFIDVYEKVLNHHNDSPKTSKEKKDRLRKELSFRNRIYSNLSRDFEKKPVISHFIENDRFVPIWAIMETLTLGELGLMLSCMNSNSVQALSKSLNINTAFDPDGRLLGKIVFALQDLRNAVAHNNPIFDVRFKTSSLAHSISKLLSNETSIQNILFDTIADYVVLIVYLMKCFSMDTSEMNKLIDSFVDRYERLRQGIPISIYSTIIHTDTRKKMNQLKLFTNC